MPSKKKKYNSRFPPARIKKIMQTDEDVGKVAAAVPVIISRALEMFIQSLIIKTSDTTRLRSAKTLSTAHIKHTIQSENQFDFLKDLVANIPDVQPGEEEGEAAPHPETVHVPRPRGRPKKKLTESEEAGTSTKPKRKRRKKEVHPIDSEETDSATEVPQEKVESEVESNTSNSDDEDDDGDDDDDEDEEILPKRPSKVTFKDNPEDYPSSSSSSSASASKSQPHPPGSCQSTSSCDPYLTNHQPSSMPYSSMSPHLHPSNISEKQLPDPPYSNNQTVPHKLGANTDHSSWMTESSMTPLTKPISITEQDPVEKEEHNPDMPLCLSMKCMKSSKEKKNKTNSSLDNNSKCGELSKEEPQSSGSGQSATKAMDIPCTLPYPGFNGGPMPLGSGFYPMPGMPPYPVPPGMSPFPPGMIGYPPFPVPPMMMPPGQGVPPFPTHVPPMMDPRYMMPGMNCFPPVTVPCTRGVAEGQHAVSPLHSKDHLTNPAPSGAGDNDDYDKS